MAWLRWATGTAAVLLAAGCAATPQALPTIGSPTPTPTPSATPKGRAAQLAEQWDLVGADLPSDWPDVPLPEGTQVVTAYAIGSEPRRTWTATFSGDEGTAQDLAAPVVKALRARGYVPIAEYVGGAETNTGLYSFAAPSFAVYVVLGEDSGRPNLVITVRGSASVATPGEADDPALSRPGRPIATATPSSGTPSPSASTAPTASPVPSGSTAPGATPSPTPDAAP